MPFSLKKVGATYQRLMDVVFSHQIEKNLEVYVDSMIVNIIEGRSHAAHLEDAQQWDKKYNIFLDPANYSSIR